MTSMIGLPVARVDGLDKVTGRAKVCGGVCA